MRLLLAEDDPQLAAQLSMRLQHGGFQMVVTDRVEGVCEIAREVDVVLVGGELPDGSVTELLDCLAHDPATAAVPVIVLADGTLDHPAVVGNLSATDIGSVPAEVHRLLTERHLSYLEAPSVADPSGTLHGLVPLARCIGDAGAAVLCGDRDVSLWTAAREAAQDVIMLAREAGAPHLVELGDAAERLLRTSSDLDHRDGVVLCNLAAQLEDQAARCGTTVEPAAARARSGLQRPHLVVVDDDRPLTRLVARRAEEVGFEVTIFHHGGRALEGLREAEADVVLLDVDLPGLNGLAVLDGLARRGVLGRMKVVMLTVRGNEADLARALSAGAADHIVKPFDLDTLISSLQEHVA